jgi:hypothetical protein
MIVQRSDFVRIFICRRKNEACSSEMGLPARTTLWYKEIDLHSNSALVMPLAVDESDTRAIYGIYGLLNRNLRECFSFPVRRTVLSRRSVRRHAVAQ